MESIGEREILRFFPGGDTLIPMGGINPMTIYNTLYVIAFLLAMMWLASRRLTQVPGRAQVMLELFVRGFDDLVSASLELPTRSENRKFFPLIISLFCFLLISNFMGFLPTSLFEEPTADLNTTLAMGLLGAFIATYCAVRVKGIGGYIHELLGPLWSQEGAAGGALIAGKLSALFFFPLNIIGELAKIVSISFRLFGNILGGAIIIVVVSSLTYNFLTPIGLNLFFGFFVGTVQAFVFTMLTLTYLSVGIK